MISSRAWLLWPGVFLAALALAAMVGWLTPLGIGNAIFVAGIAAIFASLFFIRLGGAKALLGRDLSGKPIWGLDDVKRREELRRGFAIFGVGIALWAVLVVALLLGVDL